MHSLSDSCKPTIVFSATRPRRSGLAGFLFYGLCLLLCLSTLPGAAQSDREQILVLRRASNSALKAFAHEQFLSYMTDDLQLTTGSGTLLQGKSALRAYLSQAVGHRVYFVRTSTEVEVNAARGLAWEMGTWKSFTPGAEDQAVSGGKYSAQWTKSSGVWLIRSELFVTLQ